MKEPINNKKQEIRHEGRKNVVLNDQQIQEWKRKWGKIYKTTIDGEVYIWRKLKRKEYVQIMSDADIDNEETVGNRIYHRQEQIAKAVVLYPVDIEKRIEENAGLATSLSDEVVLRSGFDVAETEEL